MFLDRYTVNIILEMWKNGISKGSSIGFHSRYPPSNRTRTSNRTRITTLKIFIEPAGSIRENTVFGFNGAQFLEQRQLKEQ